MTSDAKFGLNSLTQVYDSYVFVGQESNISLITHYIIEYM
jgi:hypothetical protein